MSTLKTYDLWMDIGIQMLLFVLFNHTTITGFTDSVQQTYLPCGKSHKVIHSQGNNISKQANHDPANFMTCHSDVKEHLGQGDKHKTYELQLCIHILQSYTVQFIEQSSLRNVKQKLSYLTPMIYWRTGENVSSSCTGLKSLYLNGGGHWWHLTVEQSEPLTFA